MIIVGLLLIPVTLFVILRLNVLNTKKIMKVLLNIFLLAGSFLYIVFSFVFNTEPFDFNITSVGDYFIYSAVIFIFSPFLWIVLYHYCKNLFRTMRVHKNAKIKSNKDYKYYRDELNKISPSIVMFTSIMDTDVRKSISATILKLKLTGYIQEINNQLQCNNKNDDNLLKTEKIILKSIKDNTFDENLYKQLVEKEALNLKYIKKNNGGKILRIVKMLISIFIPIILIISSINFDEFVHENYKIYILNDIRYIKIKSEKAIENLYYNEIKNMDDYYHSDSKIGNKEEASYSYNLIRADKFEYSIVKIKVILDILNTLFLLGSIISVFVAVFMLIQQIKYFNKNYIRTIKGNELLNNAYALKNYLKDYSLIKNRTEEDLILWEYYLVYAVVLDVNVKIKDKIIEKYLQTMVLK